MNAALAGREPERRARPARGDLIAGVTVALVLIPQALAYAELAGMPPERGLYAAAIPLLVAAPLVSSPYLQTGPVALTAVLTFGALGSLAEPGSDRYIELGLLLALVVGLARAAVGLLRAGAIAYLMSRPMLLGFVPAAATFICASQLPAAVGAEPPEGGVLESAWWALVHPGDWAAGAVAFAALTVAAVVGGRRVHRLFPGVLLAVVAAIAVSEATGYGGATVGPVDAGLPPLSLDLPWGDTWELLVPGVIIALVGFAEPAAIARTFATRDRVAWSADREFVSQGAANVAAGLTGGFPVGGSLGRSMLNRQAGARSWWSGAVTGAVVLVLLPVSSVISPLPGAVLAAIVIVTVLPMIDLASIARLWPTSRPATLIAVGTFAATLAFAPRIERGVLVGLGLSVAVHLWRELRIDAESWLDGDTLNLRPQGVLWFGAVERLEDVLVDELSRHREAGRLLLHLDSVGRLDITAALVLRDLLAQARGSGMEVELAGVQERDERLVESVVLAAPGRRR